MVSGGRSANQTFPFSSGFFQQGWGVTGHVVSQIAGVAKKHAIVIIGFLTNMTSFAVSTLPRGGLEYFLDEFFAVVHASGMNWKRKGGEKSIRNIEKFRRPTFDRSYLPVVGQSLQRISGSSLPPFLGFCELRPQ